MDYEYILRNGDWEGPLHLQKGDLLLYEDTVGSLTDVGKYLHSDHHTHTLSDITDWQDPVANPAKIVVGVFAAGEVPFPLVHTFRDNQKLPLDIAGWTVTAKAEGPDENGSYGAGGVAVTDGANGEVTYTWVVGDMTDVGKYKMLLWVTDGANDLASDLITWEVYDGPGTDGP